MSEFAKFVDAFTPAEVAEKVKTLGVSKKTNGKNQWGQTRLICYNLPSS